MKIALTAPDGLSIVLFCKGTIAALNEAPDAEVFVLCEAGKYADEIRSLGVACVEVPMYRWMSPVDDLKYCWRLWSAMRRHRIDRVLNFCTKPNVYGSIAAKLARVGQSSMHVVGLGAGFLPRQTWHGRLSKSVFVAMYGLACRWTSKVWFTNRRDRDFFVEQGFIRPTQAVLSRNYLDTDEYSLELVEEARRQQARELCGLKAGERLVLMVGRMLWQKGVREFAEAAVLLRDSRPDLKLVLVAPLENASQDSVPESYVRGIEKIANFRWLGFQDDVKRLYAISDLAVLPTYYREGGYPRALLEPMAMGKPVITADSDDCRGVVDEGRNGFLVPIKDSAALTRAIEVVMGDDDLRRRFGAASRQKAVREFDERTIVRIALAELGFHVTPGILESAK